ncbi:MBOAT family O-acyltransferase [Paraburkholderia phenazinium]|uniref:Probable alginate O-acetylase AlgI n=1 Tax=Paraburkholderia phenazinium TaxID=60549 RepID=A0A1G8FXH3_9BURK|nr:MBOAT family O-acyltransferase [Paraburkholderia phenazinium]SDH86813.1 alginate O-acetyltransferase complex protein AlgI [Paraburkholderia phenazinium]
MVFASISFVFLFLPLFLLAYAAVGMRWRNLTILTFSWIFYAWWRLDFLPLIVSIAVWSWCTGRWIEKAQGQQRRYALLVAIGWPLFALIWFKYANMLAGTLQWMGTVSSGWQAVLLPIGLSFFVFGAISYSVDVYRGTVLAEPRFVNYATYQSMFGHLVAGPVVRYKWVAERLQMRSFHRAEFAIGVERFMQGFAQKILLADTLAPLAGSGYQLASPSAADAALSVLAYTLQLYFDFSAYSSMAIGLGLIVGLKFPENFDAPYLSSSLSEFWRRWHISLSSWLRDYLYIPLGGNRQSLSRGCVNLLITMALGGLWHGASWTFMVWGLWHGFGLATERLWRTRGGPALPFWLGHALLLLFVMLGWLLFRAQTWAEVSTMLLALRGQNGWQLSSAFAAALRPNQIVCLLIGVLLVYLPLLWAQRRRSSAYCYALLRYLTVPLWLVALWVLQGRTVIPFLYFQF